MRRSEEPKSSYWRDPASYDATLLDDFLSPLEKVVQQQGSVPHRQQVEMLERLHWYFTVDRRARAPTVALTAENAPIFHARMREILRHIDGQALESLDSNTVSCEVRHALLSYKSPVFCSAVAIDGYDHDQGLARLRYFVHGEPPPEVFIVDGTILTPAYSKYRACRYYHRTLLRQRIVWLPVANAASLKVRLAGELVSVDLGEPRFSSRPMLAPPSRMSRADTVLKAARDTFRPGKGGQQSLPAGWAGWKVRMMVGLARLPWIRHRFAKAWVFADRETGADDNAEHLYRWVREHHPEINAWFMLSRTSHDWPRLAADGFRLIPPGLMRQLLLLNCDNLISSHTEYAFGGFDRTLYGDAMKWRYTFLQHGVIKDDISHWLGPCEFDCFVTSSPAEHASIVDDDTPYPYTNREVKRTGLQRHDSLLRISRALPKDEVTQLLIMPTWRGGLVDERVNEMSNSERMAAFFASDYATHWRSLLRSVELSEMVAQQGIQLSFMPHPNAMEYLDAFDPPPSVHLVTLEGNQVQRMFAKSIGFITDYTSVAFTMAFLRRQVFYYQFDRESFYGGGHNWRAGYFDYDRDGFGPVSLTEHELLLHLRKFISNGARPESEFLRRMEYAMPGPDDLACQRIFGEILNLRTQVRLV